MMKNVSRKEFLYWLAGGIGSAAVGLILAACGQKRSPEAATVFTQTPPPPATSTDVLATATTEAVPATVPATVAPELAATATPTLAPSETPTLTPVPIPDLVVARTGEPEDLARKALSALGGIEAFVPKGAKVIIKPNICVDYHTYEYAATTNPWLVGAVVKMCLEAGASSVKVMDYPFGGTPQRAYERSGIMEQVKAAGGEMAYMPSYQYVKTDIPNGLILKQTEVFGDILTADVLINLPIAKQHNSSVLTLGMKNWMGVIRNRQTLHYQGLGQCIADLASRFIPKVTVVDAIRILTRNGPTGGNLKDVQKLDTVIASADFVAADSYAATLFGLKPEDVPYIPAAAAMGLGRSDLQNLRIEEINLGA